MKAYLFTIALVLCPGLLALALSAVFLVRADEFLSISSIVARQVTANETCVYRGGHGDDIPYKLEAYTAATPSVLVVGSSRGMEIRERFFTEPFYNASIGQVSSTARLEKWTEKLLSIHVPSLAIVIPDYWWFHSENVRRIDEFTADSYQAAPRVQPRFFTVPISEVHKGRLGFKDFIAGVTQAFNHDGLCRIGWQSAINQDGYGPDGSQYYGAQLTDPALNESEWGFKNTLTRLVNEPSGDGIDLTARVQFTRTLEILSRQQVPFVVVLPPMAPSVDAQMRSGRYNFRFIDEIAPFVESLQVPYVDATDAHSYGSSDCEFIDGGHGGDVVYARIMKLVYEQQEWARPLINIEEIDAILNRSAGLSMDPDPRYYQASETDVLKLGCPKH